MVGVGVAAAAAVVGVAAGVVVGGGVGGHDVRLVARRKSDLDKKLSDWSNGKAGKVTETQNLLS